MRSCAPYLRHFRTFLIASDAFVGVTSLVTAAGVATGLVTLQQEWSPFDNYQLPGLILALCVGLISLFAGVALRGSRGSEGLVLSIDAAIVLMIAVGVEVAGEGLIEWIQPIYIALAVAIAVAAWVLLVAEAEDGAAELRDIGAPNTARHPR